MYAGPVPHNQTCVMVNMSADPVAMMPGQLVGIKLNRYAHMPADPVQQYQAFLLVRFNYNIHYCWCEVNNTHDCSSRVSNKLHVCWFSTTLLNKCDDKDVGNNQLVASHGRCLVKLQQICLRT